MESIILSWSGGKDSALALYRLLKSENYEVKGLMTSFSGIEKQVNLHYTNIDLIKAQVAEIGLPLDEIFLSEKASNKEYEKKHKEYFEELQKRHIRKIAFGDIFLEPIRKYRDELLGSYAMQAIYPLWEEATDKLYDEFLSSGFQARVSAIDLLSLDESFLNRNLDQKFRQDLPEDIDVCGENGEYHSFVFNAPYFKSALNVECVETIDRDFRPEIEMMIRSCRLELIN